MADILTIIATAEWILLGFLACRWLKGWNKRFQDQMFNYDRTESLTGINPDDVHFGVDKIPADDVAEVRHGRWEQHPQSNKAEPVYTCSLCKLNVSGFEKRWIKYCPNCGAKMDGGAECTSD